MSYRTYFNLKLLNNVTEIPDETIISELREFSQDAKYAFDDNGIPEMDINYSARAEQDWKDFSKNYPDIIFCFEGEGESADDLFKMYVKNGKIQWCEAIITYPNFDETKLVE